MSIPEDPTLGDPDLHDAFETDLKLTGKAPSTVDNYLTRVEELASMFPDTPVDEIGTDHLREYVRSLLKRGVSRTTLPTYLAGISAFWKFLIFDNVIDDNPVPAAQQRYTPDDVNTGRAFGSDWYVPTVAEVREMVHTAANPLHRCALVLLAKTGMRSASTRAHQIEDLDLGLDREAGEINLREHYCRKREGRLTVFLDDEAVRVLRTWLQVRPRYADPGTGPVLTTVRGNPLSSRTLREDIVQHHAERIGIHDPESDDRADRVVTHSFRAFFTTQLRERGVDDHLVRALRGDKLDQDVLDMYTDISEEDLREIYETNVPRLRVEH